jgi:hypothetical protein
VLGDVDDGAREGIEEGRVVIRRPGSRDGGRRAFRDR